MSTEVTPESLRAHALYAKLRGHMKTAKVLDSEADGLEREQRPLPTVPGWYPSIVVERGGESCTGALLTDNDIWITSLGVDECRHTHFLNDRHVTIRWAEQDGTTPGQTLYLAEGMTDPEWGLMSASLRGRYERIANVVLAAHGTPTLPPVGEHPEPGTRGLLPVVLDDDEWNSGELGMFMCLAGSTASRAILADPRPDGAQ